VPYLLLGLQDVQWAMGNSRGARKLARTPHVNQKKKIIIIIIIILTLWSQVRALWLFILGVSKKTDKPIKPRKPEKK